MQDMKMAEKTRDHHLEDSSIVDRQRLDDNEDNSIMDHRIGDNHLDHKEDSGIVDHQRLDDNEDNSIMDHRIGDNHLDHKEDSGIVDHQRLDDNEDNSIMDHRIGDNHLDHKEDSGIDRQRLDHKEDNSFVVHHLDHKEDSGIVDRQRLDDNEDNSIVDRQRLDDNEDNSIMDHRIGDNHLDHKEDSSIVDRQRLDDNEDNSIEDRQCLDDNEDNSIMDHRIDNHLDHKEDSSIVDRQRLDDSEDNSIEDRQCLDDNEDMLAAILTLDERHFNKRKELPHPDDVEKLATYLITEINKLELSIIKCDAVVFRETVILTEARLLLYNRRRPGELEILSIAAYESRSTSLDGADMALRNSMTEFERMLVRTQDLVEIRGTVGRGVPVIIPNDVRKPLRFLAHHKARQLGGIRAGNIYMFANTGEAVVRAGDALDGVKRRADLKYPERIYANNLRKHTATIVQALNLDDNEVKWVCNHLGHTLRVHDQYYRQTSGLFERIDIAKLMLIQERNLVGRFANKKLSEIQFEGHRIKWSKEDEEELSTLFPAYFSERTTKTCPSRNECLQAIATSRENNGKVHTRKWETIKKKINNMMLKKRNI